MEKHLIIPMTEAHWPEVSKIYEDGIRTGIATFETSIPKYKTWDQNHLKHSRFVLIKRDEVLGWTALSPVSSRCVYGGVAEVSIYMAQKGRGQGYGILLMKQLIHSSEAKGIWSLQSGIFPGNTASIKLHTKVGFRFVGYREKIGKLHGVWYDNHLYERRSKVVGN